MRKINFMIIDPMGNITALVETKTPKSRRNKKIRRGYVRLNLSSQGSTL